MLTEKQIDQTMAELHDGIRSLDIWDALWLMGVQAKQAIDLAAENERLKAKLDEIRAECAKPITTTSDVFGGGVASGHNFLKQNILAIIDKDGDGK